MNYIGNSGAYYTRGMFHEFEKMSSEDNEGPRVFTMKEFDITDKDGNVKKSFIRLFVECDDPTGYVFSQNYLGGFKHWEELKKCTWFKPLLEKALHELELKHKAMALSNILKEARENGKNTMQASKYLLEIGYGEEANGRTNKVGRPSKEKIKEEAKKLVSVSEDINEDYKRIMQ